MLSIIFSANRKIIKFIIDKKKVVYYDEIWTDGIQIYPLDKLAVKKMALSRKAGVSAMGLLIADANAGKNLDEYNSCKTEEEIAKFVREDCLKKGLVEVGDTNARYVD